MDAGETAASIVHVDRMLERVKKVIGRERARKPLRPDLSYPRRAAPKPVYRPAPQTAHTRLQRDTGYSSEAIASGALTGNEMRISSPRPRDHDDDPTGMWAAFEADFDDMVAGMH